MSPGYSAAEIKADEYNPAQVIKSFVEIERVQGAARKISDERKHQILFMMGVLLLVLVLTTASLGIAMGIYAKPVFVAHMVSAGLTTTLAVAHAIVAMVWFSPF